MIEINGAEATMPQRFIQAWLLYKGMGSKSPHLTNTVGIENCVRRRKPVIGVYPEKAGHSFV